MFTPLTVRWSRNTQGWILASVSCGRAVSRGVQHGLRRRGASLPSRKVAETEFKKKAITGGNTAKTPRSAGLLNIVSIAKPEQSGESDRRCTMGKYDGVAWTKRALPRRNCLIKYIGGSTEWQLLASFIEVRTDSNVIKYEEYHRIQLRLHENALYSIRTY